MTQMTETWNRRMRKCRVRAAALLFCHLALPPFCHLALADVQTPPPMAPDASNAVLPTARTNLGLGSSVLTYGLRQDANGAPTAGGTNYAAGNTVTLAGGTCTVQPVVVVYAVNLGAITEYAVQNPGKCTTVPSDPVAQLSTSGSGSSATFTLSGKWGPLAADVPAAPAIVGNNNGAVFFPPSLAQGTLNPALGPVCFGNPGACGGGANTPDGMGGGTGMTGGENSGFGYNTLAQVTSGQWLSAFGHHVFGHEVTGQKGLAAGTDAAKWVTGSFYLTALSVDAAKYLISPSNVVVVGGENTPGSQFLATVSGAANSAGACQLTVNSTTGMLTGDTAVVTGVLGATGCNGVFSNVTVSGSTITLTGSTFGGSYTSGGAVADYGAVGLANISSLGYGNLNGSALRNGTNSNIAIVADNGLTSLTTGKEIAAIGHAIGAAVTTGNQLALGGSFAAASLTTGAGDVVYGYNADVTGGAVSDSVIIGGTGLGGNHGARGGSQSVVLGARAGNASLTGTGIYIGYSTGTTNCTSGNGNIIIAQAGDCPSSGSSNFLNLGGLVQGDLSLGHLVLNGSVPTVASGSSDCGTSPAIAGNDTVGVVTVGSSTNGGKCTVTFHTAWTTAPVCTAQDQTTGNLLHPVVATGTLTITGTLTAADKISYECKGYQL